MMYTVALLISPKYLGAFFRQTGVKTLLQALNDVAHRDVSLPGEIIREGGLTNLTHGSSFTFGFGHVMQLKIWQKS